MSVCFECCVLSGGGLCVELIARAKESSECYRKVSKMRKPYPTRGCSATESIYIYIYIYIYISLCEE